jgi:hypothetical protein
VIAPGHRCRCRWRRGTLSGALHGFGIARWLEDTTDAALVIEDGAGQLPGVVDAMGVQSARGRGITTADQTDAPGAVVLSEAAARRHWPDGNALGQRFRLGGGAGPGCVTVVGIVRSPSHGCGPKHRG